MSTTDEQSRIVDLKHELSTLHLQTNNHYLLLREISSILTTISSTLTSANQISAHERESLIARLEAIESELAHERRVLAETVAKIERSVDALGKEFDGFVADRDEADEHLMEVVRRTEAIVQHIQNVGPIAKECLVHARKLVGRDPDTGAEISASDRVIKAVNKAFWSAVATAVVLYMLSRLVPYLLPK